MDKEHVESRSNVSLSNIYLMIKAISVPDYALKNIDSKFESVTKENPGKFNIRPVLYGSTSDKLWKV